MSDFTPERLAEMKARAEAASPGSWLIEKLNFGRMGILVSGRAISGFAAFISTAWPFPDQQGEQVSNANHIATFDPPTVLALIAALEAAWAERDEASASVLAFEAARDSALAEWQHEKAERTRLQAELAEAREGLKPFSCEFGCGIPRPDEMKIYGNLTLGDFRRARAILERADHPKAQSTEVPS